MQIEVAEGTAMFHLQSSINVINLASTQVSVFPATPGAGGTKFLFQSESA
jgi:hypothetical protein